MKYLRLLLTAGLISSLALVSIACDKTPQEETQAESDKMQEAKEKSQPEPSGTEAEEQDTPIEGTPEQVIGEMRREIDAYQDKIYSSSKDVPQDLRTKVDAVEAQIEGLDNRLTVDELKAEEMSDEVNTAVAEIKKEWNQTKRQVDMELGTTESEAAEDK